MRTLSANVRRKACYFGQWPPYVVVGGRLRDRVLHSLRHRTSPRTVGPLDRPVVDVIEKEPAKLLQVVGLSDETGVFGDECPERRDEGDQAGGPQYVKQFGEGVARPVRLDMLGSEPLDCGMKCA